MDKLYSLAEFTIGDLNKVVTVSGYKFRILEVHGSTLIIQRVPSWREAWQEWWQSIDYWKPRACVSSTAPRED